jgi:hypothetical protein
MCGLFQTLIQPRLIEPEMFNECSVPSVNEMEFAPLRLDQIGVGKLKAALTVSANGTSGRLNIIRQVF